MKFLRCLVVALVLATLFHACQRSQPPAASKPVAETVVKVPVPETSAVTPGFKNRRWGDNPSTMGDRLHSFRYLGWGDDVDKVYNADFRDMVVLGGSNPDIQYHFIRDKFFAVTLSQMFVDIAAAPRGSMLQDIEAQWGPGTAVENGQEWRSRDARYGLTIARWTSTTTDRKTRWEKVRIWSEMLEAERRQIAADPSAPEHAEIRAERESVRLQQQRARDRYKM